MILPAGVQQSIDKNNIDISTGWMFASFPIWNLDYTAPLAQPVSLAAVPLADLRFLDPTVTLVIRQSASPGSLVLWSGVAVMDDDAGGGGEPEHNDLPGRSEPEAHPMAAISGFATTLQGGIGRSTNVSFGALRGAVLGAAAAFVDGSSATATYDTGAVQLNYLAEAAPYRRAAPGTTYQLTGSVHNGFEFVIYSDTALSFNIDATVYTVAFLNAEDIGGTIASVAGEVHLSCISGAWYITATGANSLPGGPYQPLDSDLTAIAALATTPFGRSLLTQADAAAARTAIGALAAALKGSVNGVAELGADGRVPSGQLPSYVDDVVEVANYAALPGTGEAGKIYVTLDTNLTYRWSGSAYVEISASLALGETSGTAYRGDRGKTAYDHSQATGNPHGTTAAQVGALPTSAISGFVDEVAAFVGSKEVNGDQGLKRYRTGGITTLLALGTNATVDAAFAAQCQLGGTSAFRHYQGPALRFQEILRTDGTWALQSHDAYDELIDAPITVANEAGGAIALGGSTSRPVNVKHKIQINGADAITSARAGDLTALKVGSLAGGGNVVADVDGFLVIEDPEDPFVFRNTEPGAFTATGSGADNILTQSSAGNRGSLTHDISEILAAGKVLEFEFHGAGISNATPATHNSSWRLTCSALSLTADSLTVETLALPANTPFRWSCRAKVFGRSIDGAPATTRRVVALLEYSRTASDTVTYYPSTTVEFGAVDTTAPLNVTWAAGLIEASSALPHDMVTQFSQIAVVPVAGGGGGGPNLSQSIGSDGDLIYTHPTGQKLFNGNFIYSWTYQGGGDYSNLTVSSTTETTILDQTTAGRNGLFPILSPGYMLGKGPIWVRVRGGYGVIGADPVLTVRVYMGATVVGTKRIDLSAFTRTTENMGFGLLFWIEPINALSPGTSLRLRTHHYGQASQGLADAAGSFLLSEDETYSNIDGTAAQNLKVTAQWSALGSQTWAFFDGIEVYR